MHGEIDLSDQISGVSLLRIVVSRMHWFYMILYMCGIKGRWT